MQYSYLGLISSLLRDAESTFVSPFGAQRDLITIINRVEHEGLSFLTITLPNYFDGIMLCLENGRLDPTLFRGFSKKCNKPLLFWGLIDRMFDDTGFVKDNVDPNIILVLRQVCYAFKKIKIECSTERTQKAIEQYKSTDDSISSIDLPEDLKLIANIVISTLFPKEIIMDHLVPFPGPGATFEKQKVNSRFTCTDISSGIKEFFGEGCCYTSDEWCNEDYRTWNISKYPMVRIATVPKTLKAPRIIAVEPFWTMMFQQSLKDVMYRTIESNPLTAGLVNFQDQSVNGTMALRNSLTRDFATIDLSEASDRISNDMVIELFKANRFLCDALQATRTSEALLPDGSIISLKKFASMGSATCFPVESLLFFIASLAGIHKHEGVAPDLNTIRKYSKLIRVYGDDIIVPSYTYNTVTDFFTSLGWKVNRKKSYFKGFFRESCGIDAYRGINVTPVYLRSPITPASVGSPSGYVSTIESINQLIEKEFIEAANFLASYMNSNVPRSYKLKRKVVDSGLGVNLNTYPIGQIRVDKNLHVLSQKLLTSCACDRPDPIEDHAALFKSLLFCGRGLTSSTNLLNSDLTSCLSITGTVSKIRVKRVETLRRSVLRYGNKLKHRWIV